MWLFYEKKKKFVFFTFILCIMFVRVVFPCSIYLCHLLLSQILRHKMNNILCLWFFTITHPHVCFLCDFYVPVVCCPYIYQAKTYTVRWLWRLDFDQDIYFVERKAHPCTLRTPTHWMLRSVYDPFSVIHQFENINPG